MEDNIYLLSDGEICRRLGQEVRQLRLRQNLSQASLAEEARISLSALKKIEKGDIIYFDSLMRVLRVLGELDVFSPLIKAQMDDRNVQNIKFLKQQNREILPLVSLLKEEIPIIRKLCETFPDMDGHDKNDIAQRALILKENIESRLSDKNIRMLLDAADLINGGLTSRLKETCRSLTDIYIDLFSLLSLGFSSKAVSTLLRINRNTIDQRKRRLKDAISASDGIEKDLLLNIISLKNKSNKG